MDSEFIGTLAGILTTISFLPQAIKSIKAEDTKSISLIMYSMFTVGVCLWLVYGFMIHSTPIIIWNAITIPMAFVILYKKIHNIIKKID